MLSINASMINDCAFPSWYRRFRRHTIDSKIIPLSSKFIDYLLADGIHLPTNTRPSGIEELSTDDETWDVEEEEEEEEEKPPYFDAVKKVEAKVQEAIRQLGGEVMPKLTWSAPKDAVWISSSRSLCCKTAEEVFLLLKSSDVMMHDLLHAYDDCESPPDQPIRPVLVLREWLSLNAAQEFRCFIRQHQLIAISQRDTVHYPFLANAQSFIQQSIQQFYQQHIHQKFPQSNYVMDVYVHQLYQPDSKVQLIDFGPFGGSTDPLLFTWSELSTLDNFSLRLVQPGHIHTDSKAYNQYPLEVVDLAVNQSLFELAQHAIQKDRDEEGKDGSHT